MTDTTTPAPGASDAEPERKEAPPADVAAPAPAPRSAVSPSEQRAALIRLALIVGAGILASVVTGVSKTVLVVLAIIVMIMLHELGHFLTAKAAGMKVTEYFLGFGPRIWSVRRGETEYGVKAIPAGGYVKIIGMSNLEEVAPGDEARTYRQQPYWRRLSVAVAGSTMHFIIAFFLLWVTLSFVGVQDGSRELPRIGSISRLETGQSPAQQAGLRVGDTIVGYQGHEFSGWDALRATIRPSAGVPIVFDVRRRGQLLHLTATPVDLTAVKVAGFRPPAPTAGAESYGFVGIGPAFKTIRTGPVSGVGKAASGVGRATVETVKALGGIFSPHGFRSYGSELTGHASATPKSGEPRFSSPVGIVRLAGQAASSGLREVLILLFTINVFVGIFNMVPLLPLDGGHVAIATYERIRSRRGRPYHADVAKLMPLTYGVFLLLVFLGVTSLYLDIVKPLANPFQ